MRTSPLSEDATIAFAPVYPRPSVPLASVPPLLPGPPRGPGARRQPDSHFTPDPSTWLRGNGAVQASPERSGTFQARVTQRLPDPAPRTLSGRRKHGSEARRCEPHTGDRPQTRPSKLSREQAAPERLPGCEDPGGSQKDPDLRGEQLHVTTRGQPKNRSSLKKGQSLAWCKDVVRRTWVCQSRWARTFQKKGTLLACEKPWFEYPVNYISQEALQHFTEPVSSYRS